MPPKKSFHENDSNYVYCGITILLRKRQGRVPEAEAESQSSFIEEALREEKEEIVSANKLLPFHVIVRNPSKWYQFE